MTILEVLKFISKKTGASLSDTTAGLENVNNSWRALWLQHDIGGQLYEIDVSANSQRFITLPWYVYQIRGVRRYTGTPQTLYTPRVYYQEYRTQQDSVEWVAMHKTPLMNSLVNSGPLTVKARRANPTKVTLLLRGPGEFGTTEVEEIVFEPGETERTTSALFRDVVMFSKSDVTNTDYILYDIADTLLTVLPSNQKEVWCQVIQATDRCLTPATSECPYFTVLYKEPPTIFTNVNESIPDDWGLVLQNAVVADILNEKTDKDSQVRSDRFDAARKSNYRALVNKETEGIEIPVSLSSNPFTTLYGGTL
jgi:hypothetical protein